MNLDRHVSMQPIEKTTGTTTPGSGDDSYIHCVFITAAVGVAAGCGGTTLALLLRFVQHHAYGYSLGALVGSETFLAGASSASPERRLLALVVCGLVAGVGWWVLYRFGRPLVSIAKGITLGGPRMPFVTTAVHDLLQIVTVGLGSPLGREVAPRELGAVFATMLSDRMTLTAKTQRIMIACGAGAGLAAVYNVPLSGTLFTLEVLLGTFQIEAMVPALATSVIATLISWIGLGNRIQYPIPDLAISGSLLTWSILAGPLFGLAAFWFVQLTGAARARAPRDWRLLPWSLLVFSAIGLLSIPFPQLLGNGKGIGYLSFESSLTLKLAAALLVLRLLVILASLRAGAAGGLLTPGMTVGCLLAVILGSGWNHIWPAGALGGFAIVGGAAFLASSMKMPLTAVALMMEFTRADHDFLVPISLAVAGSAATSWLCATKTAQRSLRDMEEPHQLAPR
jgi:H+/Cl- antiporter ClcA